MITLERFVGLTLVQRTLTATFHKAVASDPGCTSNSRCFFCPAASLAVLREMGDTSKSTEHSVAHFNAVFLQQKTEPNRNMATVYNNTQELMLGF